MTDIQTLTKFAKVLEKKITQGVDRLESTDISAAGYERTLNNILTSITVLDKISFKPQPNKPVGPVVNPPIPAVEPEPKKKTEPKKEDK